MCCHFLVTDANPNKWPQHVAFWFSWWQTILWLNCISSNFRNLKEYPRWLVVFGLETWKRQFSLTDILTVTFYLWSMPDRCKESIGFLYWYEQLSHLLLRLAVLSYMHLAKCLPHVPKMTLSLVSRRLFVLILPTLVSLTLEHRKASANMGNSQSLQIQLHLSKDKEGKHAVNKNIFSSHTNISILTAFILKKTKQNKNQ